MPACTIKSHRLEVEMTFSIGPLGYRGTIQRTHHCQVLEGSYWGKKRTLGQGNHPPFHRESECCKRVAWRDL